MFENISSTLQQCACFFIAGAVMGLFYEALRFFRMLIRHNTVAVCAEDTLFLTACGFVSFIIALTVGIGYFRIYYIVFELTGAAVYFLTLGRLLNFLLKHFANVLKRIFRLIFKKLAGKIGAAIVPIAKKIKLIFGKIAEIFPKTLFYRKRDLKSTGKMLYNTRVSTTKAGGESSGVIKAQIRKKTS